MSWTFNNKPQTKQLIDNNCCIWIWFHYHTQTSLSNMYLTKLLICNNVCLLDSFNYIRLGLHYLCYSYYPVDK